VCFGTLRVSTPSRSAACRFLQAPAEPQIEAVVVLGALKVKCPPVHPHDPALAGHHRQIGTLGGDLHARSVDPGDGQREPDGTVGLLAVVVRLAGNHNGRGLR
jgi:hypothetical protein